MSNSDITYLPVEITCKIFNFLSSLDIVNCSLSCSFWHWLLQGDLGVSILHKDIATWTWVDNRLVDLFNNTNNLFASLAEAVQYRHEQNLKFHHLWSRFTLPSTVQAIHCLLLGPAIDTPQLFGDFFKQLLTSMDTQATRQLKRIAHASEVPGWSGQGIGFRIPMSGKENSTGHMIVNLTTLHARPAEARQVESSRLRNSLLMSPLSFGLAMEAIHMFRSTQAVIYAVDIRRDYDFNKLLEAKLELSLIASELTDDQTLVILGLSGIFNKYECLSAVEVAELFRDVLQDIKANWRLWCTSSDGKQYTNITEIFQWTFIDVEVKRLSVAQQSTMYALLRSLIPKWMLQS